MGLLSWLNRRGGDIVDPVFADPGFKRADRALEKGAVAGATVVGIEQKFDDSTTNRFVAVAVPTANGTRTAGPAGDLPPDGAGLRASPRPWASKRRSATITAAPSIDAAASCAPGASANEPAEKRRRNAGQGRDHEGDQRGRPRDDAEADAGARHHQGRSPGAPARWA